MSRSGELVADITRHNDLYFNGTPEITDAEFDQLVREGTALVEYHKSCSCKTPELIELKKVLEWIGAVPSHGKKVAHPSQMGSLRKIHYDNNELIGWTREHCALAHNEAGLAIVCSPKIDGVAIRIVYRNGRLVLAATRGDGSVGQDVTDNVLAIESIPNSIPATGQIEIRGEIHMPKSVFRALHDSGERSFANPRNAAAGSLNQKDPTKTAKRGLALIVYDVIDSDNEFESETHKASWVEDLGGFTFVELVMVGTRSAVMAVNALESRRSTLDYCIDGAVFSVDSTSQQDGWGWTSGCPNSKIAYKFKPEQATTTLLSVDYQVGRSGKLTPMARIEPTLVDGSTISNITLHNWARVVELGLRVGDELLIEKAGDIIPQVVRVARSHDGVLVPAPLVCPACHKPVTLDEKGVAHHCHNDDCPAQLAERVLHYIGRMGIKGVGSGIVDALLNNGLVKDLPDLYTLDSSKVAALPGMGKRSGQIVVEAILTQHNPRLDVFLSALGIESLGRTTSKLIANEYCSIQTVLGSLGSLGNKTAFFVALTDMEGIGSVVAGNIVDGLEAMHDTIESLLLYITPQEIKKASGTLSGNSFCLTGKFTVKKAELHERIEAVGGEIVTSVKKTTTYLVQSDPSSKSSKTQKAEKYGVVVISESELLKLLEEV